MVLVQKWPFFQLLFFRQYRPGKSVLRHSRTKKRLSRLQKKKFKKSKNGNFSYVFKPLFWSKNSYLSNLFFLGKRDTENVFYDILEGRNACLSYKDKKIKRSKNCLFSKGVNPQFWFKNGHFSNFFFFRQNRAGKCLLLYSTTKKTPFQAIKTRGSKSRKTGIFPKGLTLGFGPKMAIFSTSFFRQYRQEKSVLRHSRTKKRLSRL